MEGSRKGSSSGRFGASSMFPFGSPINASRRSVLSPGALQSPAPSGTSPSEDAGASGSPHVLRGRVRAQDVYGGPLAFGGTPSGGRARKSMLDGSNLTGRSFNSADYSLMGNSKTFSGHPNGGLSETAGVGLGGSSHPAAAAAATPSGGSRRSRLMFSASPYHSAASARIMQRAKPHQSQHPRSNTPSPSSCGSSGAASAVAADGMSSTARLILDTLDKMSTPLRDAQKMLPFEEKQQTPSRAEKRKLIAEHLNLSATSQHGEGSAAKRARRRPNLGGKVGGEGGMLKGPPTRSTAFMSPTPARTKARDPPAQPKPPVQQQLPEQQAAAPKPPPTAAVPTFGGAGQQQLLSSFGGGKIKSTTAKSGLRQAKPQSQPQPPTLPAAAAALPPPPSQLAMTGMPNITFSSPQKKPPAVAAAAAPKQFAFSLPQKVGSSNRGLDLSLQSPPACQFRFTAPQRVNNSSVSSLPRSSVLPDLMTHNAPGVSSSSFASSSSLKMPVMKMPSASVAPKPLLKSGSVMELLGGNSVKLPDVTSTGQSNLFGGIKPAAELKTGSVMSILGKSSIEPTWDPKFKSSQKPWQ